MTTDELLYVIDQRIALLRHAVHNGHHNAAHAQLKRIHALVDRLYFNGAMVYDLGAHHKDQQHDKPIWQNPDYNPRM